MRALTLFRCLGDPTRLGILEHLAEAGERSVTQLVAHTRQERTNVSHHLAQLRACGLVRTRNDGPHVLYAVAHSGLATLISDAGTLAAHIEAEDPKVCIAEGCC